jgi:hypothetical protein
MSSRLGFIVLPGNIVVHGSIGYLIGRPKGRARLGFWLPRITGRSGARSTASRSAPSFCTDADQILFTAQDGADLGILRMVGGLICWPYVQRTRRMLGCTAYASGAGRLVGMRFDSRRRLRVFGVDSQVLAGLCTDRPAAWWLLVTGGVRCPGLFAPGLTRPA